MNAEEFEKRYEAAMHAMQTGVAMKMDLDNAETRPKHLRVGVNAAMLEHGALSKLLLIKGLVTVEEYRAALVETAEAEAERYVKWLSNLLQRHVTLY